MATKKQKTLIGKAVNSTKDAYDDVKDKMEEAKDKMVDVKESTEDLIKKNPLTSIAIAVAVGAIVALGVNALVKKEERPLSRLFRYYFD